MGIESGVKSYVQKQAVVTVNFPVDFKDRQHIACVHCPFLSSNMRMCQLNKLPVAFPENHTGEWCPLETIETEDEDNGI